MEAVEFLKERKRMCDSFRDKFCEDCPLFDGFDGCGVFMKTAKFSEIDLVDTVEKWVKCNSCGWDLEEIMDGFSEDRSLNREEI